MSGSLGRPAGGERPSPPAAADTGCPVEARLPHGRPPESDARVTRRHARRWHWVGRAVVGAMMLFGMWALLTTFAGSASADGLEHRHHHGTSQRIEAPDDETAAPPTTSAATVPPVGGAAQVAPAEQPAGDTYGTPPAGQSASDPSPAPAPDNVTSGDQTASTPTGDQATGADPASADPAGNESAGGEPPATGDQPSSNVTTGEPPADGATGSTPPSAPPTTDATVQVPDGSAGTPPVQEAPGVTPSTDTGTGSTTPGAVAGDVLPSGTANDSATATDVSGADVAALVSPGADATDPASATCTDPQCAAPATSVYVVTAAVPSLPVVPLTACDVTQSDASRSAAADDPEPTSVGAPDAGAISDAVSATTPQPPVSTPAVHVVVPPRPQPLVPPPAPPTPAVPLAPPAPPPAPATAGCGGGSSFNAGHHDQGVFFAVVGSRLVTPPAPAGPTTRSDMTASILERSDDLSSRPT